MTRTGFGKPSTAVSIASRGTGSADSSGVVRLLPLVVVFALVLALPHVAQADDYGVFVDVETEEDLLDLLATGEIDETAFDVLVQLLHDGVDLNSAGREALYSLPNLNYVDVDIILDYREDTGPIQDPAALIAADVISRRKLAAIAPFLVITEPSADLWDTSGRIRYRTSYVGGDDEVPSMWLGAEVSTLQNLKVGLIGVLSRTRLSDVSHDPVRDALSAKAPSIQFHVPKYFIEWETDDYHIVGGTYRIGFGQRLTFDNTEATTPNGIRVDDAVYYSQDLSLKCRESAGELDLSPCRGMDGNEYRSPDYKWTNRLRGLAAGLKSGPVGDGWFQAYAFGSYQTKDIYQYEIYDRTRCDDPTDDDNPSCKAPTVFRRRDDPRDATSRFSYQTLPEMFNELTAGANLAYFFDRRSHIGITGYGADVHWLVEGMDLDFQEWSRLPYGGPFGAVGIDASWGADIVDLFAEVTRSFDSQPAGDGWAGIFRATLTWTDHELETSARYYHRDFNNPYARPVSAADEFDGLRARDEMGIRVGYTGVVQDLELRSGIDFWTHSLGFDGALKMRITAQMDYRVARWFKPGIWVEYQDRDLDSATRLNCYEVPFDQTPEGEPVPCSGEKFVAGLRLKFVPHKRVSITAKYQHRWLDDGKSAFDDRFRQDLSAWLMVAYTPIDKLQLRARVRYLYEDIADNGYLEQSIWGYLQVGYWFQKTFGFKLRYEIYAWLDDRTSTDDRFPNPAHWLRAELEYRF